MSNKQNKIKVGISVGDVNGIGVEIILKSLAQKEVLDLFTPIIFGSSRLFSYQKNFFDLGFLNFQGIHNPTEAINGKINIVNLWKDQVNIEFGQPTPESGKMAIESLEAATQALKNNTIDVLVTAPIDKKNMQSNGFSFPGHTEYLESELEGKSLMLMTTDDLKVALVTQHIALEDVPKNITTKLIQDKAFVLNDTLKKDFSIAKPKIAVLALNPHAGDKGVMGDDEQKIIQPAIEDLFDKGVMAFGPYPADSFFTDKNFQQFDGVLAMYHDQGLIPFKSLFGDIGVNYTAGLSKIRTSPDHGVAFDIAGKNEADETSMRHAIYTAIDIFRHREQNEALLKNALQTKKQKQKAYSEEDDEDISSLEEEKG